MHALHILEILCGWNIRAYRLRWLYVPYAQNSSIMFRIHLVGYK